MTIKFPISWLLFLIGLTTCLLIGYRHFRIGQLYAKALNVGQIKKCFRFSLSVELLTIMFNSRQILWKILHMQPFVHVFKIAITDLYI